jgi:hypothetical protein
MEKGCTAGVSGASILYLRRIDQGLMSFKRSRSFEFRIAAVAVLALCVTQLGAIAHAYTHQPASAKASAYRQVSNSHEFCGECLSFAPLLATAGAPAALPFSLHLTQSAPPPAPPPSFVDHRTYLAFRSRTSRHTLSLEI